MKVLHRDDTVEIAAQLNAGKIGVVRTDTLYGIVCRVDNQAAVERVYAVKDRNSAKSPIVLVATPQQLFDNPGDMMTHFLETVWPGKTSVIIPSDSAPVWIERGNTSVAYRLPNDDWLQRLLQQTGPLIAPSANPEGQPPAQTVQQAIDYFGEAIDFYVDGGEVSDMHPSQLVRLGDDGTIERLR